MPNGAHKNVALRGFIKVGGVVVKEEVVRRRAGRCSTHQNVGLVANPSFSKRVGEQEAFAPKAKVQASRE